MTAKADQGTPALSPLKRAFLALEESRARIAALESGRGEPVAVIGIGCRVPGAGDPAAFWRLLESGVDATGDVPPDRWDADAFYDPDPEAEGRIMTRRGGFLEDVASFDAEFFGIAPREAQGLDPQQRLVLEVAWEALEHAGIAADRLEGSATGVYLGMASGDYCNEQVKSGDPALLNAHFTSGIAHSMGSGRLSYLLGLQGPSITIDTACSSSLVALHLACRALQAGDCRLALAGGVNLILSPDLTIALSHSRMLAPDGRCKTFDAAADGFARGEGCGMVVLKLLRDALADGDRVLAVVRGTAVNQDGPSSGLTAPNGPAQEAVIREALRRAGLVPGDIGYLEAHGTGTQLGDPLEMGALGNVFGPGRDGTSPLVVGSVKTNLGHLEAAAGITAVIKVVLALQARTIPPHLHFRNPSPHVPWDRLPVRVPTRAEPWQPVGGRRIAGVSSFGFSGTNAHVILEERSADVDVERPESLASEPHLLVLSARDEPTLRDLARRYSMALAAGKVAPADACRSAATGRASFSQRAAMVASSREEMVAQLDAIADGGTAEGVRVNRVTRPDPPRVAFLFTGQGAQYPGMALGLYARAPAFRQALDRCAASLDPLLGRPLLGLLREESAVLDETRFTQPALFAVEYALAELWRHHGIEPMAVMGHSVGEYVAACTAGVLGLDDAIRLVATRGRLMQSLPAGGAMAAIFAPEESVRPELVHADGRVAIAAVNAPGQVVISGVAADVAVVSARFAARGVRTQALPVSHAFHSPLVEPVLDEFEAMAQGVAWRAPRLRLVSNLTGRVAAGGEATTAAYWRRHMREAVRFEEGLRSLAALRPDIVIEVGPHPTLLAFAEATLGTPVPRLVPTLRRNRDDWTELLHALGAMHLDGARIEWRRVYEAAGGRVVDLPTYPFQRSRHWFTARRAPGAGATQGGHPLLGARIPSPLPQAIYEAVLRADEPSFLAQHVVQGQVVVPATAWLEMLSAAGTRALPGRTVALADVTVQQALILEGTNRARRVHTVVEPPQDGVAMIRVSSQPADAPAGDPWDCHVTARAVAAEPTDVATLAQARGRCSNPVDVAGFYASFAHKGLAFGDAFHTVRELWRGHDEALGRVALGEPEPLGAAMGMHPVLLDGCVQVLAAALAPAGDASLYLPIGIGRFALLERVRGPCWSHATLVGTTGETVTASISVFDESGRLVAFMEDLRLKRVAADALARQGTRWLDDAMLEVQWSPVEGAGATGWSLPSLASSASAALAGLRTTAGLEAYDAFLPALDALCLDYVERALVQLGWQPAPGDLVSPGAVASELGVVDRHRRLFARVFEILTEGGLLAPAGSAWVVRRPLATGSDPEGARAALLAAHPLGQAELEMTGRAGAGLAAALRGTCDPMDLLFPAGSIDTTERLYRDSPPAAVMNGMMAQVVATALASAPEGRPLRILEVGAGTGGTTTHLIPMLGTAPVEYTFTDVGPLFVARARERFAAVPGMKFGVLDLEQALAAQGIAPGHYDLVIASNVVHATRDLRRTLARLREALVPGGLLVLLEVTAPQRWFDLTVGLTPGWWAFEDTDLRPSYPTVSRDRWLALLADAGFAATASVPDGGLPATGVLGLQALLLAQAGLAPSSSRTWLIFTDGEAMTSLASVLEARGDRCILVRPGTEYLEAGDEVMLDPLDAAHYDRLFRRHPGRSLSGVVFGWPLQASLGPEPTPREAASGFLAATCAAQALVRGGESPRLWFVTRGGQWTSPEDHGLEPIQATIWGLARSLPLEHPELGVTAVDLDPAQARDSIDGLADLLDHPPAEPQVALRNGRAHTARLVRHRTPPAVVPAPWRLVAPNRTLERLERVPLERRLPGPGLVEIEVEATGLNFKDVLNALGMYPGDPGPLGGECAGRVVAVGPGVDHLQPGDDVVALAPGCFASHVLARADFVLPRPPHVSAVEAATLPIAFLTASFGLEQVAGLRAGESVLIHAAAGGVGMAAVRVAQRVGAEVHATAGAPWKRDLLRAMGVAKVYDSRSTAFAEGVLAETAGKGVDVVLNSLAGEMLDASFRVLAPGGRFVELGKRGLWTIEQVASLGLGHQYHVVDWGETMHSDPDRIRALFVKILAEAESGALEPLPRHAFPVERCDAAFQFMARARHAGRIVVQQRRAGRPPIAVSPHGTYLITGGLAGLGLVVARRLAERGAGRLVLVGRRGVPDASRAEVEALSRLTRVETLALDVSQATGVAALLDRLRREGPPLRGVIHSAGVVADAAFLSQDVASVTAAFAPKVVGAALLDRFTRADALDFFVLFSSVAGVLGSAGQANHAGANAYLDLLAARRRADGLPGLSVAWGPWTDVGAAADRGMAARLTDLGLGTVTPGQGLQALERAMGEDLVQVTVQPSDWHTVLERQPRRAALLAVLASGPAVTGTAVRGVGSRRALREEVALAPAGRVRTVIAAFVREQALKALGLDQARVLDPAAPLGDLGLDSLLAVELRNTLGAAIGKSLPATLLFDCPTVDALTDFLIRELGLESAQAKPGPGTANAPGSVLGAIEDLSDDEVDRRLALRARKR